MSLKPMDFRTCFSTIFQFYTCGSRRVANGIKEACITILKQNRPTEDAREIFDRVQKERFASDVFD